ncbi:MAG: RNase adapter RapZ [Janthinobacterium lividum]
MRIVLITGISGSGKSVALTALEDAGYYCVDNLPPRFLPELAAFLVRDGVQRLAIAVDARSGSAFSDLPAIIGDLRVAGHSVRVLFLNASTQALIQRFSETRRKHPLSGLIDRADGASQASLADAIERERELVADLAALGHQIDTSTLRASALRAWVRHFCDHEHSGLTLMFESFAFKRGVPLDADFVFDVRVLPNPFYERALRPLTGLDAPVQNFLGALPEVREMLDDIAGYLRKWLPKFRDDSRAYLTVALGCTGGQHRSVYLAQQLASIFETDTDVLVRHRELAQPGDAPPDGSRTAAH